MELVLADLESVENVCLELKNGASKDKTAEMEMRILSRIKEDLKMAILYVA